MRAKVFVAAAACGLAGCDGLAGLLAPTESGVRLLLYASPRQITSPASSPVSVVGAEVVVPAGEAAAGPWCVQLSAPIGTLAGTTLIAPPPDLGVAGGDHDAGGDDLGSGGSSSADLGAAPPLGPCTLPHCGYLVIPARSTPYRGFALYQAPANGAMDVLTGVLYASSCPPTDSTAALTSQVLTVGIPDVPPPAPDLAAAQDLGVPEDLTNPDDLAPPDDLASIDDLAPGPDLSGLDLAGQQEDAR